jgi:hypothetical protein
MNGGGAAPCFENCGLQWAGFGPNFSESRNEQMKHTKQRETEDYKAAIEAVRRLTDKQKLRLLAELQDDSLRLDLADLTIDADLSSLDLNTELPDLDLRLPDLDLSEPDTCPICGKRIQQ